MSQLPLRVRNTIRDAWDAPTSAVQSALAALAADLGLPVTLHADFPTLIPVLRAAHPSAETLVPRLGDAVAAELDALRDCLTTGDRADARADAFLARLGGAKGVAVYVEAHNESGLPLSFTWDTRYPASLLIRIPRAYEFAAAPHALDPMVEALCRTNLHGGRSGSVFGFAPPTGNDYGFSHSFGGSDWSKDTPILEIESETDSESHSEWDDLPTPSQSRVVDAIDMHGGVSYDTTTSTAVPGLPRIPIALRPERMPHMSALPPPKELFARTAPYYMELRCSETALVVCCSHLRTLEAIEEYLQRYLKTSGPGSVSLRLKESIFGSAVRDVLELQANDSSLVGAGADRLQLNPTLVLSLIEGVLGYRYVGARGSQALLYRRDRAFAV